MSIVYCDYLTGDDATGSGTNTHPYKTITQASTGLTGGDEVRCAKSTAATTMSGTLAWVDGSTSITTSADLTSVLSPGDFVGKDTAGETWWEAITITSNTLTLYKLYSGTTETVSSKKLGVTSTGEAAGSSTNVQTISHGGSSVESRLKISGGWDLSTETQDGHTYFRQMHGTFNNRYGRGLYSSYKDYIELDKLSFLRYSYGVYQYGSDYCYYTNIVNHSNVTYGIYINNSANYNTFISPICNSNGSVGIYIRSSDNNTVTTPICNSNGSIGIYIYDGSDNNIVTTPICNSNGNGMQISNTYNSITNPTCNNNLLKGVYLLSARFITITNPICNNNSDGIYLHSSKNNTITTPTCNSNSDNGMELISSSHDNTFTTPTCSGNSDSGIGLNTSNNNTITNPTFNNNNYVIYSDDCSGVIMNNLSATGNSNDVHVASARRYVDYPILKCQHFNTVGDNRCYYEYGVTYRDTADARSGECLKFDPKSSTYYIRQNFNFRADSGVGQTLSAYIKDDASFNGDIQAAIYFLGAKITGWTEWTPTTSYVQKSIVAASGDITEDSVLELAIKVRGTAGNVYVDDLGAS